MSEKTKMKIVYLANLLEYVSMLFFYFIPIAC